MLIIKDKCISPYNIQVEGSQFTVGIPKVDKHGVENLSNTRYFTNLSYALKYIGKELLVSNQSQSVLTLREFSDLYKEVNEMLIEQVKI